MKLLHPGHRLRCRPKPARPAKSIVNGSKRRSGRNAVSIFQDLVEQHGFKHRYNSVKRFVRGLKAREPERFDVLESLPGEEAQVDFGQGALTRVTNGKYRRPYLFVMTLKYSGKSFRKVLWKADQQSWARLHEEAFHAFGGVSTYVVLDNLKQGVIRPDLYEPHLSQKLMRNPKFARTPSFSPSVDC